MSVLLSMVLLVAPWAAAQSPASGSSGAEAGGGLKEKAKEHFFRGNALFKESKYAEAGLAYRKTLELMPGLANPHKNLARCYIAMKQGGMLPDVAFHLLRYLQLKPDAGGRDQVRRDLRRAVVALKLKGRQGKELQEVSALLEELGTEAAEEEKWTMAVRRFAQLRDLNPERPEVLKLLAESYLGALRCDEAERTYNAYLLVHPEEKESLEVDALLTECQEKAEVRGKDSRAPGKLIVISNVTSAAVLIDGKRMGRTPLDGPVKLGAGDHQIALFKEGYETLSRKVTIPAGGSVQAELRLVRFDMDEGEGLPAEAPKTFEARRGSTTIVLLPMVGLMTGLGGSAGTALGPSFGLELGRDLTDCVHLFAELGVHLYSRQISEAPPFREAQISSTALPFMGGLLYRYPLGGLRLFGGMALGMLYTTTSVSADAGDEASVAGVLLCLRVLAGGEMSLGPGSLVATISFLGHPFNTVGISYQGDTVTEDLVFGGLGLHLGYRYVL